MNGNIPQDLRYTDLTPAQVAFLQQTVPVDAARKGLAATLDTAEQSGGLMTVTIHFGPMAHAAATGSVVQPIAAPPMHPQSAVARTAQSGGSINFATGGEPLTQADIDQAVIDLGQIEQQLIWAIIKKESETLTGFLPNRQPVILYERHIFAKQSHNLFTASHGDISGPPYRTYGTLLDQYTRLDEAIQLDRSAALEACSWGLGQILGENAVDLGYADVEAMVTEMIQSEGKQLRAVVAFLKHKNLTAVLRNKNWDDFSNIYNGGANPTYANLLQEDYNFYVSKGLPDLNVRAAQLCLSYLGYSLSVDGRIGDHTQAAVAKFQVLAAIHPANGTLDQSTLTSIRRAVFG